MLFGVPAAPAIFQRTMKAPNVCVYLDDILVTGKTEADYLSNLYTVLTRLDDVGVHLKQKCLFKLKSMEYLGHNIAAEGL